ncbi:MAG: hypothetical protein VX677_10505 [Candidatus Poribacteria bacterium]|nr:hypothetical protein [Candidatus Poribacteria bacterium]
MAKQVLLGLVVWGGTTGVEADTQPVCQSYRTRIWSLLTLNLAVRYKMLWGWLPV